MHSSVIASLLDTRGSHGQKTEESGGRVDICIENSIGQMIVIENKIFAGDQGVNQEEA